MPQCSGLAFGGEVNSSEDEELHALECVQTWDASHSHPIMQKLNARIKKSEPSFIDPSQALLVTISKAEESLDEFVHHTQAIKVAC